MGGVGCSSGLRRILRLFAGKETGTGQQRVREQQWMREEAPAEMLGICQLWHFSEVRQSLPVSPSLPRLASALLSAEANE